MLKDSPAFAGFSTNDLAAARRFYEDTLGLNVTEEQGMLRLHPSGGGSVLIYQKDDHRPATFTVLNFPVADIHTTVDALDAAGVRLERYPDMPQDERGILRPPSPEWGPPIAWFKDPAGNIVSVIETGG